MSAIGGPKPPSLVFPTKNIAGIHTLCEPSAYRPANAAPGSYLCVTRDVFEPDVGALGDGIARAEVAESDCVRIGCDVRQAGQFETTIDSVFNSMGAGYRPTIRNPNCA